MCFENEPFFHFLKNGKIDWKTFYRSSERYLIGSDQRLELTIGVSNEGEDAYEATLFVSMPSSVSYVKTEMMSASNAASGTTELSNILCSPPTLDNGFVLKCDLGNPMLGYSTVSKMTFKFFKAFNLFFLPICTNFNHILHCILPLVNSRMLSIWSQFEKKQRY